MLERVTIESDGGFELGLELTVKAYALGMRLAEVPTTWNDRTAGQSHFKLWEWLPRYLLAVHQQHEVVGTGFRK